MAAADAAAFCVQRSAITMTHGPRLAALGATGVLVAGLAHAGWWLVLAASSGFSGMWLAVGAQIALTAAVAAGVAWQTRSAFESHRRSLQLLHEQARSLQSGQPHRLTEPVVADAAPLAASLNAIAAQFESDGEPAYSRPQSGPRRAGQQDADTGFDTRFTFLRRLTERLAARDSSPTSLVCLKLMADGAQPGEAQLARAAELLRGQLRTAAGAFAGRLSATELAVCLPSHQAVGRIGRQLMDDCRSGHEPLACVVATVDRLGGSSLAFALDLLRDALADAYAAGPGSVESAAGVATAAPASSTFVADDTVASALRGGRARLGEFPVLDPYGQMLHLECPLRVQLDPEGPFEPAERWLPLAARAHATARVDLAALDLALAACAADGTSRCVHVAAESVASPEFVDAVSQRLAASPQGAARLWIEISEGSIERLPARLRNVGATWRRHGVRVGVEHAGAALRGLVRLGELDLDYVKVDPAFIRGVAADPEQRDWARGLVAFVHEFGASVYAEGADDAADLAVVWDLGFDGATGRAVTAWHRQNEAAAPRSSESPPVAA